MTNKDCFNELINPGAVLLNDFLRPNSITPKELSIAANININKISQIINGKRIITPEYALKFAEFFKTTPEFWTDLQTKYDLELAKYRLKDIIPDDDKIYKVIAHQPHDKIFKAVFYDRVEAEYFFKGYLPETLTSQLDWETLLLESSNFIDEELRGSESDLLYNIKFIDSDEDIYLYLLFENQLTPQKWMRFRLYKYKGRIWDESLC